MAVVTVYASAVYTRPMVVTTLNEEDEAKVMWSVEERRPIIWWVF